MKELNQALRAIRKNALYFKDDLEGFGGYRVFFRKIGICSNVWTWLCRNVEDDEVRQEARRQLGVLIRQWERQNHLEGRRCTDGVYPIGYYEYRDGDLWNNPRRWQLLGYLIRETMQ